VSPARSAWKPTLTFHFPSFLSRPDLVTVIGTLGLLLGVYLFIRGFRRLQRAPVANSILPASSAVPPETVVTITSRISDEIVKNSSAEVIRLSPEQSAGASLMSQQSRIAAALNKAGMANPVSWNGGTDQGADGVRRTGNEPKNLPPLQTQKLRVTRAEFPAPERISTTNTEEKKPAKTVDRKPGWMLWLGGALALAGAYALAFHFRLL
jgi:hypothetical protein